MVCLPVSYTHIRRSSLPLLIAPAFSSCYLARTPPHLKLVWTNTASIVILEAESAHRQRAAAGIVVHDICRPLNVVSNLEIEGIAVGAQSQRTARNAHLKHAAV